ncbi:hypothetical protein B0H17DRAFT_1130514 [Mycena rosella]|uniref:Uncharacterized protein n=1 Tax=Mycena rosella TaxID=1033263 RepID=A0AAD7DSF7_MYCRO|nr:hypothetical protein B0H17DRAFT_1130514 [Mycena rosella]
MRISIQSFSAGTLLGLLAPSCIAAPVIDMVAVSGRGYRPKSNVHEIPAGAHLAHVDNGLHLIAANGTILHAVPPAPATYHGQTVYLFNAINGEGVVQSVLAYGPTPAGGGELWFVASWYLWDDFI